MTSLELALLVLTGLAAVCAAAAVLVSRYKTKRMLESINAMLDAAMDGSFTENTFDESLLSAAETRLAHYLAASCVSAQNLQQEKDKIKELIADISHQTKPPIANILLYAQLLAEQELPPESRPCVAALGAQAEKLRFLIGSLVKTSRLEAGVFQLNPGRAQVQPMLDAALAQIAPKAAEKQIAITCTAKEYSAFFDRKWTAEAIYNILDNAVKYTPAGGHITIQTACYQLFCRIDLADTGMGIPEQEQARIFGRFYRSPAAADTEGVGIGLYLVRQIVAGQGGYIKVQSAPGQGACFSVFLPLGQHRTIPA